MIKPSVNDLLTKVDSRYTLVSVTAKRARQIIEGSEKLLDIESNKPVTIATHEIFDGKVTYEKLNNSK